MRLILVRHGVSEKNLACRHGGPGDELTSAGVDQMVAFVEQIRESVSPHAVVLAIDRPQCVESAEIIRERMGLSMSALLVSLPPFGLGVIDGLTEAEVAARHPELADLMSQWRRGEIEISDLTIPGSTGHEEYFAVAEAAVSSILDSGGDEALIVGTRSTLIALTSVLLGRRPTPGGGYREIAWDNGGFLDVVVSPSQNRVDRVSRVALAPSTPVSLSGDPAIV